MSISNPLYSLDIKTNATGFYAGFNTVVTIGSKCLIGLLILWAAVFPEDAGAMLSTLNSFLLDHFNYWYMDVVFFYIVACVGLALWPKAGKIHLGLPGEKLEFSKQALTGRSLDAVDIHYPVEINVP